MSQRTDVDPSLSPVPISGRILNEVYSHALSEWPEECCGLIVGDEHERYGSVVRCRNEMTKLHQRDPKTHPRDGKEAFYMNEHDYLAAQEKAEDEGRQVTAVYHSHVGAAAYLSAMDREYAESRLFPFPEADHIVVSVLDRKVAGVGVFRREGAGSPFRGCAVVPRVP